MGKPIGIDLGTTNSRVAVLEDGQPVVISNSEGGCTTPSMVGFGKAGDRLVGQLAKRQAVTNAENTIFSIKRLIGRRWEDTQPERARVPYNCVKGKDDTVDVQIQGRVYTGQEISAIILQKLKQDAENYLGETVTQAVITVPAYFSDAQRQATKDAGTIAGLEVLRIINEPTAAALAYGLDKQDQEQCVLVFDLGGGTFDVSILQLGDGVFEVKATSGNNHLGGDDFDDLIVQWMMQSFQAQEGIDLSIDKMALQRLREAAEKAKIELSSRATTSINLPFITADHTGSKHLETELSRSKFEELTHELVESTLKPVRQVFEDTGLTVEDIDRIILVGGSTRIPAVQEALKSFCHGKMPDRSITPDEAVALGAAIQAGVLGGEVKDLLLLDVTPLSMGIETLGEVFTRIIDRNTTIPTSKSQVFSTATDGQTSVEIHALQGERAMAKDNKTLGKFQLTGIPPAPRGVPQIEVSFEIDANGILKVSALDKGTGRAQGIEISNTGGLSGTEIERMRQEAELFAEEDELRIQRAELKNRAERLFSDYESTLRDNGEFINEALKTEANQKFTELREAINNSRVPVQILQRLFELFQQMLYDIGAAVYQQTNQADDVTFRANDLFDPNSSDETEIAQSTDFEFEDDDDEAVRRFPGRKSPGHQRHRRRDWAVPSNLLNADYGYWLVFDDGLQVNLADHPELCEIGTGEEHLLTLIQLNRSGVDECHATLSTSVIYGIRAYSIHSGRIGGLPSQSGLFVNGRQVDAEGCLLLNEDKIQFGPEVEAIYYCPPFPNFFDQFDQDGPDPGPGGAGVVRRPRPISPYSYL